MSDVVVTKNPLIDLSNLDTTKACDEGAEIELLHPVTREPLGQFISIVGKDSRTFREHIARTANADRQKAFLAKRRNREPEPKTFQESENEGIELLVACTKGFRCKNGNYLVFGGTLSFSPENARKLYRETIWIRTQIDEAIVDLENFIKS